MAWDMVKRRLLLTADLPVDVAVYIGRKRIGTCLRKNYGVSDALVNKLLNRRYLLFVDTVGTHSTRAEVIEAITIFRSLLLSTVFLIVALIVAVHAVCLALDQAWSKTLPRSCQRGPNLL